MDSQWVRSVLLVTLLPLLAIAQEQVIRVQATTPVGQAPMAGQPVDILVSARDPATGSPLVGSVPALWLAPISEPEAEKTRCEVWVSRLLNAPVVPAGVIDLNGFDVVQATDDGRLALVDPQLNLASANIKAIVSLGSAPDAWAIDADGRQLWAALGHSRTLVRLTLEPLAIAAKHELANAPTALAALGTTFWAGTVGGDVLRIDPQGMPVAAGSIGSGRVLIDAAGEEGLFAVAENGGGVFITHQGLGAKFAINTPLRSAAFAPLADTLYALDQSGKHLIAIPRDSPTHPVSVALSRRSATLTASPDGRWLALTAETGQSLSIYDTMSNRERWTIEVADPMISAVFSDAFLYLTHRRQGGVSRVVFDPKGGPPGIVTIAAGATGDTPQQPSPLPLVARIPKAGIFIASARDRTAYMVSEESMAPMSSLPLRAGKPVGILLRYRGLIPAKPEGDYTARAVPPYGGPYLAIVRIDQPNLVHCTRIEIAGTPDPALTAVRSAATRPAVTLTVAPIRRGDTQLLFALIGQHPDHITISRAMLIAGDSTWRQFASDVTRSGDQFMASITVDNDGPWRLYVEYIGQDGEARTIGIPVPLQEEAKS